MNTSQARLTHPRHFHHHIYNFDEIFIPGGLVLGLTCSAANRDLHEVLHEVRPEAGVGSAPSDRLPTKGSERLGGARARARGGITAFGAPRVMFSLSLPPARRQDLMACDFINNLHPGDTVGALSFVRVLEENVGGATLRRRAALLLFSPDRKGGYFRRSALGNCGGLSSAACTRPLLAGRPSFALAPLCPFSLHARPTISLPIQGTWSRSTCAPSG